MVNITSVLGGAQEPQSGYLDGVEGGGWEGEQGGRRLVQFLEAVDMPVVVQRQVPQQEFVAKVVDIPVGTQS